MSVTAAAPARRREWRALAVLLVIGLAILAMLQAWRTPADAGFVELHQGEPAKLSPFLDAAGRPVRIEDFRGRTVVLNLWAPWCVPCLQEMPSLDRLAARLPKDFAVVAVTKDPVGASPSKQTFERMGLKRLALYLDPEGKLGPEIGARGFPTTLILGPDGVPVAYREGAADWDIDAMVAKLEGFALRSRRAELSGAPRLPDLFADWVDGVCEPPIVSQASWAEALPSFPRNKDASVRRNSWASTGLCNRVKPLEETSVSRSSAVSPVISMVG